MCFWTAVEFSCTQEKRHSFGVAALVLRINGPYTLALSIDVGFPLNLETTIEEFSLTLS
jgi:hypothetical protein